MGKINNRGKNARTKPVLPGRVEPTPYDSRWSSQGDSNKDLYPPRKIDAPDTVSGQVICPTCHAVSDGGHWLLNEKLYQKLRSDPNVTIAQCPACRKIERQMFDGEVVLAGDWLKEHAEEVLNLVRNEEKRGMETNPMSRLASMERRDGQVYILTTTEVLARRIGTAVKSAFKGELEMDDPPYESFIRVRWHRDS